MGRRGEGKEHGGRERGGASDHVQRLLVDAFSPWDGRPAEVSGRLQYPDPGLPAAFPMRAFSSGRFGTGQRLPVTGFVVFGLLTFWIYSVLQLGAALRAHLGARWTEFEALEPVSSAPAAAREAARREGFEAGLAGPRLAAALLAASALVVAFWFWRWILAGDVRSYGAIMAALGASCALFYGGVLAIFLWALGVVRRHELAELMLREGTLPAAGSEAPALSEALLARWEKQTSEATLFLVVALPMVFSPMLGGHLFLTGAVDAYALALPAACFAFAATFHAWGTWLLLKLYNSHLVIEARHAAPDAPTPTARPANAPPIRREGHHDVFLSHSAKDKPVADAICAKLEQAGIRVWIAPRDIRPGANWGEAIIEALEGCRAMVIVFSASANASPQVLREVERAVGKGVAVIPFRIENVVPSKAMEYFLSSPHWLDAMSPPLEGHIDELVASVGALMRAAKP